MSRPLLVLLALLCACSDKAEEEAAPTLSFLTPEDGGTVAAGDVTVTLIVENFTLEEPASAMFRAPGAAFAPWLLPGSDAAAHNEGVAEGYCALSLDGTPVATLYTTQHELAAVGAGEHTLSAELFYSDGDAVEPPVSATITFTAE